LEKYLPSFCVLQFRLKTDKRSDGRIVYNKVTAYYILGYIPISKKYSLEKIRDSLDELLKMHPILSMHLTEKYEVNDKEVSILMYLVI